ncbi:isoniazid inducible gene protein IniC [Actinocatenispora thailandica]|uniref:Isoniazid inducible gene protein IniC n=1 Tax=Actinocatenispora thailandica TaxID=227318 RepID=A0A7R7DPK2_9ACTN|nr:dynamin family protein [Actinocatenispora thailandica]BCJ35396.1 isoniazid inducible gene protein IniC [Actinocatenispora thailandica]
MSSGPLSSRVQALCGECGPRLAGSTQAAVVDISRRLGEPLRVAIAGRLKSGKSTLVNSLIGRRVAPTEVGECTRLVTQFRYGTTDRIDVVRRDGSRASLPLDESGMIPQKLGVPRDEVAYVDVTLTSDRLEDLTVVDTPGLSSTNSSISDEARRFLFNEAPIDDDIDDDSAGALSGAEAIVYVFTQSVREDDLQALKSFQSMSSKLSSNPINSLGLFNKVDKLSGTGDPWPVAEPLANQQGQVLRRVVSDVVPVIGLLAETTEAGRLTAADCEALRTIASMSDTERQVLLASVDLFIARDCAVSKAQRERLLRLLDIYGVSFAVAQFVANPRLATGELVKQLFLASGFPRARSTLERAFRWRTDAIKAGWALTSLEKIAGHAERPADRELLRDAVERVLQQPEYHRLRMLDVAQQVTTGSVALPEDMENELTRLALSDDPHWILGMSGATVEQLAKAALEAATRWRAFAVAGASPAQARIAHVVHRGFFLLSQQVRKSQPA